jgi:isoquinoline 1-oxidoreductase subunit beta
MAQAHEHPRNLAVLNAGAERIGWGKPVPQGIYRGLAQMMTYNSYVTAAAEISVTGGNKIKIHRLVGAIDCTYAVNPAQIDRQMAGSFVYGLSALFYQECTVEDGRIMQTNFDNDNSMRIAEMPKVESIVMPSGGTGAWGGVPPETFPPERVAFRLEMAQSGIMQAAAHCDSPVTKRSM